MNEDYHDILSALLAENARFIIVGAHALAAEARLPEERQTSCVRDYKAAAWSWDLVLKPHRRAPDQPKSTINVTYKDEEKYPLQSRVLRHMRLLEAFAELEAAQPKAPDESRTAAAQGPVLT